jgi:hypothetical protein
MRQSVAPLASRAPLGAHYSETRFGASDRSYVMQRTKMVRSATSPKQRIFGVAWGC